MGTIILISSACESPSNKNITRPIQEEIVQTDTSVIDVKSYLSQQYSKELNLFAQDTLGLPQDTTRLKIINGDPVLPGNGDVNYQVGLFKSDQTPSTGCFCGGTIINEEWILTAAHCLDDISSPEKLMVFSGSVDRRIGGTITRVAEFFIHPDYEDPRWANPKFDHDIALIRLETPLNMDINQGIALLPEPGSEDPLLKPGNAVIVSGWGQTESGYPSHQLMKVEVNVVDYASCNTSYNGQITENMLCAADYDKDSCQGDSGGPLVVNEDGKPIIVGVVSWGNGCALTGFPGVYCKVHNYLNWIDQHCNCTNL